MSDSVKVVLAVCATVVIIAVVAAVTSVTLAHGDTSLLIRNLGLVAAFLVAQIPVLINQIRARDKAIELSEKTSRIEKQVNGTLQETVHDAVQNGITNGVAQTVQQLNGDTGGQAHGDSGSVQSGKV